MMNKRKSAVQRVLLILFAAALLVSCRNLPTRVPPEAQNQPSEGAPSRNEEDEGGSVQPGARQPVSYTWTEPEPGPTVTPIILSVERKGDEGSMIVRSDSEGIGEEYYDDFGTDTSSYTPGIMPEGGLKDDMELYSFNPFIGSIVLPSQALHLDIQLKNTGTTTWQTTYKIVDYSEQPMAAQKEFNLPRAVAPGDTVVISVYMTAPAAQGSYPENFWIEDAYGVIFGRFDYALTVGTFSSVTDIPTLPPTVTPTYYSADGITATPDTLAWMCIDPERSKLQDCYQFCVEYSDREEFKFCFYDGVRYTTPVP